MLDIYLLTLALSIAFGGLASVLLLMMSRTPRFATGLISGGSGPAALYLNESPTGGALRFQQRSDPQTDLDAVTGAYPIDIDGDGITDLAVLRVVVKRGFSHDVADLFVADLKRQLPRLERQPEPVHDHQSGAGFRH